MVFKKHMRIVRVVFPLCLSLLATFLIYSCDKGGVVGADLVPQNANVTIDTIPMVQYDTSKISVFSGDLPNFSVGMFNDPLFGNLKATGLVLPPLFTATTIDTLTDTTRISMVFHITSVYGDTNQAETFDIVQASRRWRGRSWRIDSLPPATNNVITSFSVGHEDSVTVPMPQTWVKQYRQMYYAANKDINADSAYAQMEYGFVIVPTNQAKIVSFSGSNTLLATFRDTVRISTPVWTWAYSLKRNNEPAVGDSVVQTYSTFERVPSVKIVTNNNKTFSINGINLDTKSFSRVQIVLYEDNARMANTLAAGQVRPAADSVNLYYMSGPNLTFGVLKGPITDGAAAYRASDHSFRLDLTDRINVMLLSGSNSGRFYFVPKYNDGIIQSLLLTTPESKTRYPKLIVTSVKPPTN